MTEKQIIELRTILDELLNLDEISDYAYEKLEYKLEQFEREE